jgi:hypothetical protein
MAAVFVQTTGGDLFKRKSGSGSHLIKIPSIDSLVSSQGLAVYDTVAVQLGETIQYFLTFDDVIKYIHFGKAVGNITVGGTMFSTCSGELPGLSTLLEGISQLRGKETTITVGGAGFTAVMTNVNITLVAEPDTMAMFQVVFSIVNHNL